MAADQIAELALQLDELQNRVRILVDADAIRNLKARYAAYCDDNYNPDKIAELFVEDAVWESGPLDPAILPGCVQNLHIRFALRIEPSDRGQW